MAITDYSSLKLAVADWLVRADLTAEIPTFISLGEGYLSAELRVREMVTTEDLTPTDGQVDLPDDLVEVLSVTTLHTPRRSLSMLTTFGADHLYTTQSAGRSDHYSITGGVLSTFPWSAEAVELVYYAEIPALSDAEPTNWLLAKRPELYLRAALMQGAEFIKDDEEAGKQKLLVDMMISQLNRVNARSMGRGGITLRGPTP